jgi:hypothetical protein
MQGELTSVASSVPSFDGDFDNSIELVIDSGEYRILAEHFEDTEASSTSDELARVFSGAVYGNPLSKEEAAALVPPGIDGLVRHSIVIPDKFCTDGKLIGGLNKRDFDLNKGTIKPQRASLPVTQTQLLSSLTKIEGPEGPRYIFNGVLNGWPSLRNFELIGLEKKFSIGPLTAPDYMSSIVNTWDNYWSADKEGKAGVLPAFENQNKICRAKLRAAPWSSVGW